MMNCEKFNNLSCSYDYTKHEIKFSWSSPLPMKNCIAIVPLNPDGTPNYREAEINGLPPSDRCFYKLKSIKNEVLWMNFIVFAINENRITSDVSFLTQNKDFCTSTSAGMINLDYHLEEKNIGGIKQCSASFLSSGRAPSDVLSYAYYYKGKFFKFQIPEKICPGENKLPPIYIPEQAELMFELNPRYQKNFSSFKKLNSVDYLKNKLFKK